MTDLPLIKAAKLWAKVSARTGAAYLTGRWGGCRVLVFENLEHASEAGRQGPSPGPPPWPKPLISQRFTPLDAGAVDTQLDWRRTPVAGPAGPEGARPSGAPRTHVAQRRMWL